MKSYDLQRLTYNRDDVIVTRNGRGPGRVAYNGKYAGEVVLGKGGVLEYRPVRWVSRWEHEKLVRERAILLYKQQLSHFNQLSNQTKKVNGRRKRRRRSFRAKSLQYATS